MIDIDFTLETSLKLTPRVKQLSGMFDVPPRESISQHWQGRVPIDEKPWNVGLIVGPSGAGKSSCARQLFGQMKTFEWKAASVIDDFGHFPIQDITATCSAVGFNTVPSWMKPFRVLSTGEQFRADLARRLLEGENGEGVVMVDEFTSVVDRQVAKIGSHAVQKLVRKRAGKFVAVSCHYDIAEWLQPDWILEPATMTFQWRAVQRRPELNVEIAKVSHAAWKLFAPFHYLTGELHRAAQCFVLWCEGQPASFIGMLPFPHPTRQGIWRISRAVTLPDYQGLGLVMSLESKVCGAYRALGYTVRGYPAHPSHVRSLDRSPEWKLIKKPGEFSNAQSKSSTTGAHGGRPCAVFEFIGAAMDKAEAKKLLQK